MIFTGYVFSYAAHRFLCNMFLVSERFGIVYESNPLNFVDAFSLNMKSSIIYPHPEIGLTAISKHGVRMVKLMSISEYLTKIETES